MSTLNQNRKMAPNIPVKSKIFLLVAGANGAGKSTVADQYLTDGYAFLNPDIIQKNRGWTDAQTARHVLTYVKEQL